MDEPPCWVEEAAGRAVAGAQTHTREPLSRRELDRLCRELRRLSQAHRRLWVANRSDAGRAELVGELIRRADAAWDRGGRAMVAWAQLAVQVADALPPTAAPAADRADLLAQAWSCLGNTLRVAGDLRRAERALQTACSQAARGSGSLRVGARVDCELGLLRRRQRRFDEAAHLILRSASRYEEVGDALEASRSLVSLAITSHEAGDLGGAVHASIQALQRLDPERAPLLVVAVANNLVAFLLQLGRVDDATDCFQAVKRGFGKAPPPTEALRLSWLEAKLAHATGQRVKAQALLDEVRRGFIELELPYDAALAGLELALRYAEAGRPADVERLATEMYPTFISSDLPAPAMATLMLFVKAVDAQAAHPAGIRELLSTLETQRYAEAD